jgi:hypothetical protein
VKARISRTRAGTFVVRLTSEEREVLGSVAGELRELLTVGDPSLRRLFPPAYANDPDLNAEYDALVHDDLLARRLGAIDTLESTLSHDEVDETQLLAWMGAVNDLRLVLGTRLDVSEDMDAVDRDDPAAPAFALYHYLSWLLSEIIDALDTG